MTPRLNQSEKDAAKYQKSIICIRKLIFKYGSKDELKEMRNQYKSNENDIVLRHAYLDYRKYRRHEKTVDKLKEKVSPICGIGRSAPQDVSTTRDEVPVGLFWNETQLVTVDTTEPTRNCTDVSESVTNSPTDTSEQIHITEDQSSHDESVSDEDTFLLGCANCRRRQSNELIAEHGNVAPYFISFVRYVIVERVYYFNTWIRCQHSLGALKT